MRPSSPCSDLPLSVDIPQYSFTNVKKMEPLVDMRIRDWLQKMNENFVKTGHSFDFSWWAVYVQAQDFPGFDVG